MVAYGRWSVTGGGRTWIFDSALNIQNKPAQERMSLTYFNAYYTATMFNILQKLNRYLFWDGNAGSFFLLSYQFAARRLKQLATKRESQVFKTV